VNPSKPVSLVAVGDICPGDHYFSFGHGAGSLSAEERSRALAALAPVLKGADIALCNLEGVVGPNSNISDQVESRVFRGPSGWARSLREAGFTAVGVANNHSLQHGLEAFEGTVNACRQAGLDVVGLADRDGSAIPVIRSFGSARIVLLGASLVPDRRRPSTPTYAAPAPAALASQVSRLAADGSRVVVYLHAGEEERFLPDRDTMATVASLAKAGASAILVHHSHVFQPVFHLGSCLVASGLGDCVFDLHWHPALTTAAALVASIPAAGTADSRLVPFRLKRGMELELLGGDDSRQFQEQLALRSAQLLDGAAHDDDRLQLLQLRKLAYFIAMLPQGESRLKFRFLAAKGRRLLGMTG
jgi:poly-gamma-glutamate synthesis protein (capsule biosynthesis protein)